jgi:ribose 5-phosphate isomerase A
MNESLKRTAAVTALDEISEGMSIGLGTGSTVNYFIRELGNRVREGLKVRAIATSVQSELLAAEVGVSLVSFRECPTLDLTVDGADEVSTDLSLVKGLGGALVREKIVAMASNRLVIVVDASKLVDHLGTRAPVPIEVVPFADDVVIYRLKEIGGEPKLRQSEEGRPFVSDNGNHVVDWHFGPILDPAMVERRLKSVTGVVDSGIFSDLADRVIVARETGVEILDREN